MMGCTDVGRRGAKQGVLIYVSLCSCFLVDAFIRFEFIQRTKTNT